MAKNDTVSGAALAAAYLARNGETIALDTADGIARAAADLGDRVADLETRAAVTGGVDVERFERLEHVLGPFFGRELAEYDALISKQRETS